MDPFRRFGRLLWMRLTVRRRAALHIHDVARVNLRVWPTDLDELRHVNNGVYLSMMDHPRLDLMQRSGVWSRLRAAGIYPVVTAQTIAYRKSLKLWQRYAIDTRILGYDQRAVYIEQRVVVREEIYARAFVKGRFLRDRGGVVPTTELAEVTGIDVAAHPIPAWLAEWSERVALPSTREVAGNDWT